MAKGQVQGTVGGVAASIVCSIMFLGINFARDFVPVLPIWGWAAGVIVTLTGSFLSYRLLLTLVMKLFGQWAWVRRLVLGRTYLEGTWIGHYEREEGHLLSIEVIDQQWDHLQITGRAVGRDGKDRTSWKSTSAAFDPQTKQLHYSYECKPIAAGGSPGGLGVFTAEYTKNNRAARLHGYAIDIGKKEPDQNDEYRIAGTGMSDEEIFMAARKQFPREFGADWPAR